MWNTCVWITLNDSRNKNGPTSVKSVTIGYNRLLPLNEGIYNCFSTIYKVYFQQFKFVSKECIMDIYEIKHS